MLRMGVVGGQQQWRCSQFVWSLTRASFARTWLALLSVLLLFCWIATASYADETTPWHIAVAGPMSGDSARLGQAMIDSVQMRLDEVNAAGGIQGSPVNLLVYDDQNSAEKAAEVAQEIGDDPRTLAVIGHRTSGASIAASPFYLQKEIAVISGTATADIVTVANPWYFRATYNNSLQAEFIANYMNRILGFQTATLVSSNSVYANSLARAFVESTSKLPLEITHQFSVDGNSEDLDLDMADIVAELTLLPDSGVVFLAMNAQEAAISSAKCVCRDLCCRCSARTRSISSSRTCSKLIRC